MTSASECGQRSERLTSEQRSNLMSRVKGKNTKPELLVRSHLHRLGYRFRLHRRDLPGRPDVVLPRHKTVIFVHGCFWHRHQDCSKATTPKSHLDYWLVKFAENTERDARKEKALRDLGWRVIIVWQCEVSPRRIEALSDRLRRELTYSDPV